MKKMKERMRGERERDRERYGEISIDSMQESESTYFRVVGCLLPSAGFYQAHLATLLSFLTASAFAMHFSTLKPKRT